MATNRTKVELKQRNLSKMFGQEPPTNRTKVELKHRNNCRDYRFTVYQSYQSGIETLYNLTGF